MSEPTKRKYTRRTPGLPAGEDHETDADAVAAAAPGLDDGDKPASPEILAVTPAQLAAIVRAEVQKAVNANTIAQSDPKTAAPLPDQDDIDLSVITRPTLTKQGYVVPKNYGEAAAELQQRRAS